MDVIETVVTESIGVDETPTASSLDTDKSKAGQCNLSADCIHRYLRGACEEFVVDHWYLSEYI